MPDRLSPGKSTTALSIGLSQDGSVKLATGDTIIKKRKNKNKIKVKVKLATSITTIGTWNVRTLSRCGKLEELSR